MLHDRYEYPSNQVQSKTYMTVVDAGGNGVGTEDEVVSESWSDGAGRTLKSRTEHPGSVGGYAGSVAEYNSLGQMKRSTVPTEINSSWIPSGDDDRGSGVWLWKSQEYDWKGRVTREINTDGTDRLISYEGCGCAGGQITTIQSELVPRDDQPSVNARRTQKVYSDILGRNYKTEILKWDGSTVYTTTVQTFNGRDQVTNTRQYDGAATSSTFQDVTMTFDGHGRMKTRHYPIEDPGTYTEWIYNGDDTVDQIIDPRQVITEMTYNDPRGLLTKISYQPPSGSQTIPDAPDVDFTYDALGNRTSMTDGTGNTTYTYSDISRLTAESKYFNDLPNAPVTNNRYNVGYTYNLAGGLKSLTDPFGHVTDYGHDNTGKLLTVDGDATTNNPNGNYVSGIKYRAFGSIKQMDYKLPGETAEIKMDYNDRLIADHFEAPASGETSGFILKSDYAYASDKRLVSKNDALDDKFDRTFKNDFAGRRVFEQWGMGLNVNQWEVRVFEQSTTFNAFSMMTSVTGTHWDSLIGFQNTYQNGRIQNSGLVYDAAGNQIGSGPIDSEFDYQETDFDAAGRRVRFHSSSRGRMGSMLNMVTESVKEFEFDGDGRPVSESSGVSFYHESEQNPPPVTTEVYGYQVWSSVVGRQLTSLMPDGTRLETNVYAGGALVAKQNDSGNSWEFKDPITGSKAVYAYDGSASIEEFSGLGQKVSPQDPAELPDPPANEIVSFWENFQWQCGEETHLFWGSFGGMPFHCQMQAFMNPNNTVDDFNWIVKSFPVDGGPPQSPSAHANYSATDDIMSFALSASSKPVGEDGGQPEPGDPCTITDSKGNQQPGTVGADGQCKQPTWSVNVARPMIDMDDIPGSDVSVSGGDTEPTPGESGLLDDLDHLLDALSYCAGFLFTKGAGWKATGINEMTGRRNGSVTFAKGENSFTVATGNNFTDSELGAIAGTGRTAGTYGVTFNVGYSPLFTHNGKTVSTDPTRFNYVARDYVGADRSLASTPSERIFGYTLTTQIHELGHSLMARFLGQSDYRNADRGTGYEWEKWRKEIGWQYEKCVTNKFVDLRGSAPIR